MKYRKITVRNKEEKKQSILERLLASRGIVTPEKREKFLNPSRSDFISPYAFCDMKKAVERVQNAIEKQEKILIWGDFDCDGVTSSTILYKVLKRLGAVVEVFIPNRVDHGHGLNSNVALNYVSKEHVKLFITVDCGISNISEISLLKALGVDTILTDHHTTDIELPKAYAIINPQVRGALDEKLSVDDIESLTYNSGSIVAYKFAMALLEKIDDNDFKDELLVISSCGAIADVVPLLGENRAIVKEGLNLLNTKRENAQKGIYRLLSKNIQNRPFTSYDIGFILAPRINAMGRLKDASLSFKFLNEENSSNLDMMIVELDSYNSIRQAKCTQTYEDIRNYLSNNPKETKNPAVILMNEEWDIGIIGIAAAKVTEEYQKPCFLLTKDKNNFARCSIRSLDPYHVYEILKENESLFSGFGGHKLAGGFSFELDKISFEEVKESILKTIFELYPDIKQDNTLYVDIELESRDMELSLLDEISELEPFGQDNPTPLCSIFDVVLDEIKPMGKNKNHLKLLFSKDDKVLEGVKWGESEISIPLKSKCDLAFYPRLNSFNEVDTLRLDIVDMYSLNIKQQEKEGLKIFDHRKKTGIFSQIASYFERENLDIAVWAKTISTKEVLNKYEKIKENFLDTPEFHNGLMLFDYPSGEDELRDIVSKVSPKKIHLMNQNIDENIENYIKQLFGMLKYSSNHKKGTLELDKMALALGVNENFIQLALEILDNLGSVKILDIDKIEYIKPQSYGEFKESPMFEVLNEEFEKIINFKKTLLNCDIDEFSQLIK